MQAIFVLYFAHIGGWNVNGLEAMALGSIWWCCEKGSPDC
jgi:hypothetical protein